MTITEFAIIPFHSPPEFSEPHFQKLSAWQAECSGFPLLFFTNVNDPLEVHLMTGWESVAAHEAWIRGERNQELLRVFKPYVDMEKLRMVHLDVESEAIGRHVEAAGGTMVVERHGGQQESERSGQLESLVLGRNLAQDNGDVYVFRFDGIGEDVRGEQWVLKKVIMNPVS